MPEHMQAQMGPSRPNVEHQNGKRYYSPDSCHRSQPQMEMKAKASIGNTLPQVCGVWESIQSDAICRDLGITTREPKSAE